MLTAEGYLESRPRSGFFVQEGLRGGWDGPCWDAAADDTGTVFSLAAQQTAKEPSPVPAAAGAAGPDEPPCPAGFDIVDDTLEPGGQNKDGAQCPSLCLRQKNRPRVPKQIGTEVAFT